MNNVKPDPTHLQAMRWRCIGPHRGGRVAAVAGHPTEPAVFYFGACAGGVWKTEDAGTYWENVSDGYFTAAAIGALTVSEADPNVIYAGTGETNIRLDVSYGDGVYKSTDAGRTWTHIGLRETKHIGEIRVHPKDPDLVYVAAQGHVFGPNEERGVYRSKDGGATWENVLYVSNRAGAVDLTIRTTRASSSPQCGRHTATSGLFPAAARTADCTVPLTVVTPGRKRRWGFRPASKGRSALPPRQPAPVESGPWSRPRRAASIAPTTAVTGGI